MMRLTILASLLLFVALPHAFGGEDDGRTIALPRHGLSIDVPAGWEIDQYGDAVLQISKGKARLWVRTYAGASKRKGVRVWGEWDGSELKVTSLVERDDEVVFEIEGVLAGTKARKLRPVVEAMLDSVDTTEYEHATRHVDWKDGWTLDLPEGFARKATTKRVARFESDLGYVEVVRLDALYREANQQKPGDMDLEAWTEFARSEGLARIRHETAMAPTDDGLVTEEDAYHLVEVEFEGEGEDAPEGTLFMRVGDGVRVLAWIGEDEDLQDQVEQALVAFRAQADPGPKAGTGPTDRFPGESGPPVAFDLPDGWTMSPGSNRMRLAQVKVPDVENADVAVFYFGAGGGGGLEGNLKRWRDQMGGAEGETETVKVAEGVKATLLRVKGTFQSSGMGGNPHGGNPHGMGHDDFLMLAAILEVPEGPLFVKWVGPEAKVKTHEKTFRAWIGSFRVVR